MQQIWFYQVFEVHSPISFSSYSRASNVWKTRSLFGARSHIYYMEWPASNGLNWSICLLSSIHWIIFNSYFIEYFIVRVDIWTILLFTSYNWKQSDVKWLPFLHHCPSPFISLEISEGPQKNEELCQLLWMDLISLHQVDATWPKSSLTCHSSQECPCTSWEGMHITLMTGL